MTDGGREQSYAQGVMLVILATLGWSLSGVFVRYLPGLSGFQINCWRGYWMSVALLIYLVARYGRDVPQKFQEIPWPGLLGAAGFFAVGSTLYVTSLTLAGTAAVSVVAASAPIFTGLLSPWVTAERPSAIAWIAALLALVGVAITAWGGFTTGHLAGTLVSLLVPISFAGQTVTLRRYRGYDMVPALCVGGFATFLIAGALGGFHVTPKEIAILALMGPLQLSIPLIFFARGARSVPAVTLSLIVMLDVVLNPLWSWLGAGEQPARLAYAGGAIVVAAVLISIFGGMRATSVAARAKVRLAAT
jgi:drug/metabolite transporter (DMT)-like permease